MIKIEVLADFKLSNLGSINRMTIVTVEVKRHYVNAKDDELGRDQRKICVLVKIDNIFMRYIPLISKELKLAFILEISNRT